MGTHKNYPYEIKDVDSEESKEIFKYFTEGYQEGFIRIGPKGYFLTNGFKADAANVYHLPLRRDDVCVMSIPKSGTTWTQELVWMIANNFDYVGSNSATLPTRFPFLEQSLLFNSGRAQKKMRTEFAGNERLLTLLDAVTTPGSVMAEKIPSPRFLKTHLALSLLPPSLLDVAKVVYVARDPRDVAVSYYHHDKLFSFMGFTGDFKQFWECFVKGRLDWTPYFPHVLEAWEQRNHPNFLFMFYEDMLKDLTTAVRRVADFLGKSVSNEEMAKLCTHLSFNNFKNNNMVNFECARVLGWLNESKSFVRKGKSGEWREYFDEEMSAQAQRWIDYNLRESDLRFPNQ